MYAKAASLRASAGGRISSCAAIRRTLAVSPAANCVGDGGAGREAGSALAGALDTSVPRTRLRNPIARSLPTRPRHNGATRNGRAGNRAHARRASLRGTFTRAGPGSRRRTTDGNSDRRAPTNAGPATPIGGQGWRLTHGSPDERRHPSGRERRRPSLPGTVRLEALEEHAPREVDARHRRPTRPERPDPRDTIAGRHPRLGRGAGRSTGDRDSWAGRRAPDAALRLQRVQGRRRRRPQPPRAHRL